MEKQCAFCHVATHVLNITILISDRKGLRLFRYLLIFFQVVSCVLSNLGLKFFMHLSFPFYIKVKFMKLLIT
jgi:hypothetical protein